MTRLGSGEGFLYGFVNNNRTQITNTIEQICAFILKNYNESIVIASTMDISLIEMCAGIIMYCRDQEFLDNRLIPTLQNALNCQTKEQDFIPYVTEGAYLISNVRYHSGAGHSIYTMSFEDGYPSPYERITGYFPDEETLQKEYPNSLSLKISIEKARALGWIS